MKDNERIAKALRKLRWLLKTDEQHEALDKLLDHLLSLDDNERRRTCEFLMEYLKEKIENQKPVN